MTQQDIGSLAAEFGQNNGVPVERQAVMRRWLFFYEGEENGCTFEVEAKDHEDALQVA